MTMTEELLSTLCTQCLGSSRVRFMEREKRENEENDRTHQAGRSRIELKEEEEEVWIDFTPPYKRLHVWDELERHVGSLPSPSTLDSRGLLGCILFCV